VVRLGDHPAFGGSANLVRQLELQFVYSFFALRVADEAAAKVLFILARYFPMINVYFLLRSKSSRVHWHGFQPLPQINCSWMSIRVNVRNFFRFRHVRTPRTSSNYYLRFSEGLLVLGSHFATGGRGLYVLVLS
jgi:hypothetical protein